MSTTNKDDSFFLPQKDGESKEYALIRDLPTKPINNDILVNAQKCLEYLWEVIKDKNLTDNNIQEEARESYQKFFQRFWEMYLAVALLQRGYKLEKPNNGGPDYFFKLDNKKVWIEATAPTSGVGLDAVPTLNTSCEASNVPKSEICFRLTGALRDKHKKFKGYLEKGMVTDDDICIVAINACILPNIKSEAYHLEYPFTAFYGKGNITVSLNKKTKEIVNSCFNHLSHRKKQSGKNISMTPLMDDEYSMISGVLYSTVSPYRCSCNIKPGLMGSDFSIHHHLKANNSIPEDAFTWCR